MTLGVVALAGCSHDWDRYDPRLADTTSATTSQGGGGPGGTGASATTSQGGAGQGGTSQGPGGGGEGGTGAGGGAGGTGGTGGSGGGPIHCGGTNVLTDDFSDGVEGQSWYFSSEGGASAGEESGEGVIKIPGSAGSWAAFQTRRTHDLRGDHFSVEITKMVDTAGNATAFLDAGYDDGDYLTISQSNGTIFFVRSVDQIYTELASAPYDPLSDRYWRFREEGGTTSWETSGDGVTYDVRAQAPSASLFPVDSLYFNLGAYEEVSTGVPDDVRFDKVNGGGSPTGKWCAASSFTDDFADGEPSRKWGRSFVQPGCIMSETGGELLFSLTSNTFAYCGNFSDKAYDLTGDTFAVEVPVVLNTATDGAETYLRVEADQDNWLDFVENHGGLLFRKQIQGTTSLLALVTYDPVAHRFWRFRESGGKTYWETSPNGTEWTVRAEAPNPVPVTALDVGLGAGAYNMVVAPGAAHFDNVNLLP